MLSFVVALINIFIWVLYINNITTSLGRWKILNCTKKLSFGLLKWYEVGSSTKSGKRINFWSSNMCKKQKVCASNDLENDNEIISREGDQQNTF